MESFSRILVDIDATATAHPALERAILLAKKTRGTLTIVDVVTVPPYAHRDWPAGTEQRLMRDRRQELAQVAQGIREVQAEAKLLVGRPATVLIEEVLQSNHDLIMRSHARDLASSGSRPFGAVDMELLRKCPRPVLLVRHGQPATKPRIACAAAAPVLKIQTRRKLTVKPNGVRQSSTPGDRLGAGRMNFGPTTISFVAVPDAGNSTCR